MSTIVAASGGGIYGSGLTWVGGNAPTSADDAQLDATSGNVTITAGAASRSLDCTGYTGTLTHSAGATLTLGDATVGLSNIALKLVSGMTYTKGDPTSSAFAFVSTSTTQQTVDFGSKTLGDLTFNGAGGDWVTSNTGGPSQAITVGTITLTAGKFTGNISCLAFSSSNANVRELGACTFVITQTSGSAWDCTTATNLTVSPSVTVTISDTGGSNKTVNGGAGKVYGLFTVTAGGAGAVIFQDSFDVGGLTVTGPKTIKGTKTKTLTASGGLAISGTAGNIVTLDTEDGLGTWSIHSDLAVSLDYLSVTRNVAAGVVPFYAGTHSTDGGTNTNWTFTDPPNNQVNIRSF